MTPVALSLFFFVVGTFLLWLANRAATPKGVTFDQSLSVNRRLEVAPVAVMAVLVYWGLTALLARPVSVFCLSVLGIVLLLAGNALKVKLLGEVLLFSDVFLAGHALRFPRLYFGYVPKWVWAVLAVFVVALAGEVAQESAHESLRVLALVFFGAGVAFTWTGLKFLAGQADAFLSANPPVFRAQIDAARFTPFGAALVHLVSFLARAETIRRRFNLNGRENKCSESTSNAHENEVKAQKTDQTLRHFVLIQAESYCPVAELLNRPSTTPTIDALRTQGPGGKLLLDWRGAYTMRTEFSVITGLETTSLEAYAFDPFQLTRRIPMASLARDFKARGYDTVAWHPNDGRFFDRFAVMPHLGFSRLMDIAAFADLPREGHYVGDKALLQRAAQFLATCTKPTFLFIVTIEAHGPWSGTAHEQLAEYEEHLRHLDEGVDELVKSLSRSHPGSTVALYGDHLPSLAVLRKASPATAWFAHRCGAESSAAEHATPQDLPAHQMRDTLLRLHTKP